MKRIFRRIPALLLLGGTAALAVFVYNTWSLCCGRCSAATFLNPGPTGFLLFGATLFAIIVFFAIRRRRCRADRRQQCSCGALLRSDWHFCPGCGSLIGRGRSD